MNYKKNNKNILQIKMYQIQKIYHLLLKEKKTNLPPEERVRRPGGGQDGVKTTKSSSEESESQGIRRHSEADSR